MDRYERLDAVYAEFPEIKALLVAALGIVGNHTGENIVSLIEAGQAVDNRDWLKEHISWPKSNGWVAHHEPMGAIVWTEERPEPHPYLEGIRPATSLEKRLLQAMGGTSDGLYDARSLAAAVQLFRNEPMLKDLGKLRGTWGFARLCDSWNGFVETWPETRLNAEQMEAMKEKF